MILRNVMDCQLKQAALPLSGDGRALPSITMARDDRQHYGCPACDVNRADMVGMVDEVARLANKLGLALAIGLVNVAARWASPRGVARVHGHEFDASEGGLVAEERAQLKERPSRMHRPLALSDRCPFADARQVFDGDSASGAFGLCDDLFRDAVVGVGTEAGLLAREFLEVAFRRLGADGLEHAAETLMLLTRGLDGCSTVGLAVGVNREVADSEVDAKPAFGVDRGTIGDFDGHVEKPLSLAEHEVGLAAHAFESRAVVPASHVGNENATRDGQQRDAVQRLEAHDPLVVGDGAVGLEGGLAGSVALVCLDHLGDRPHRHLGRQPKLLAKVAVVEPLQFELVGTFQLESPLGQPVTRFIHAFKRRPQSGGLLRCGKKLRDGYKFHYLDTTDLRTEMQPRTGRRFLRPLKGAASTPRIL